MKTKYIKFCKRCNTETEHYASGHCIQCVFAYQQEHRDEKLAYNKTWHQEHRYEQISYKHADLNNNGLTKNYIRTQSSRILFNKRKHIKLVNYEIHHCFGYNDPNKFVYIPKELHFQIHQRLRDKNISAENEHYEQIKDLINECKEYTYISI